MEQIAFMSSNIFFNIQVWQKAQYKERFGQNRRLTDPVASTLSEYKIRQ